MHALLTSTHCGTLAALYRISMHIMAKVTFLAVFEFRNNIFAHAGQESTQLLCISRIA